MAKKADSLRRYALEQFEKVTFQLQDTYLHIVSHAHSSTLKVKKDFFNGFIICTPEGLHIVHHISTWQAFCIPASYHSLGNIQTATCWAHCTHILTRSFITCSQVFILAWVTWGNKWNEDTLKDTTIWHLSPNQILNKLCHYCLTWTHLELLTILAPNA